MLVLGSAILAAAVELTPEAAVALALQNHPRIAAAGAEVAAAEADAGLARSGWLPRVEVVEEVTRSTNPTFVFASKLGQEVFGPADFAIESLNTPDPLTNAATRLSVRQNVWDAGRTSLGRKAAALGLEAAGAGRARTRDEVALEAVTAFWNAVLADEMLAVARDAERAAEANAALAAEHVEAGLAVPSDRMSAEVRLAEVRALRIRAEQAIPVARGRLRLALGAGEDAEWRLLPGAPPAAPPEPDVEAAIAASLAARADLAAVDARLGQAELGERMARSRRLPEIGVGGAYELNDDDPFGSSGDNWTVGLTARLSLFDGGETRARMARARADRDRAAALRGYLAEGIRLEVRAAWAERDSAERRLAVAESALAQSGEALRIVRERYAEGMAVMVELLGAEAAQTAARAARAAAARDLAVAAAARAAAVGRGEGR